MLLPSLSHLIYFSRLQAMQGAGVLMVVPRIALQVFLGVNSNGIKLFRTDTKEPIGDTGVAMSFANLQSWSCVPGSTCSISTGPSKMVYQTELGEDICSLLKSYALAIGAETARAKKGCKRG